MRCGAGEVQARFGRDTDEMQARRDCGRAFANEIQTRSRRDSPAALPLRRGAGGESTGSANPNSPSGAGSSGGSRTATGARQRSAGEKQKGRGQPRTKRAPRSPPPRHRPCYSSGRRLRLPGGARRSRPCGWGRPRPRAPPRAAPTRRPSSAIRTTAAGEGGIGGERCTEGSRGERRAACLRRAHNVSELGELGEAAARHRGHGLDDVAHHAPGRPGPAAVLDGERDEPPDWEGEGVPGG